MIGATNVGPSGISSYTQAGPGSSGTGWAYQTGGYLKTTGSDVSLSGLYIPGYVVAHGNLTMENCIVEGASSTGLVTAKANGSVVSVTNCRLNGLDSVANRAYSGVKDDTSSGCVIEVSACDIFWAEQGVYLGDGYVENSYIHDLGYETGDHCECVYVNAGNGVTVDGNTLLNQLPQTAAFYAAGSAANTYCSFSSNFVGGCGGGSNYMMYTRTDDTGWTVEDNVFSAVYGAPYKVCSDWPGGTGNTWSGNTWNESGAEADPA